MTEAIKQWWEAQAKEMAKRPAQSFENKEYRLNADAYAGALAGLEKGIEIAEGFPEWANKRHTWVDTNWWHGDDDETFTTSQLLEKYLSHLLNKEK